MEVKTASSIVVFIFLVPLARSQAQESPGAPVVGSPDASPKTSLPRRAVPMGVRIDPQITDRLATRIWNDRWIESWSKFDFGNAVNKIRLIHSSEGVTEYAIGVEIHRVQIPTGG